MFTRVLGSVLTCCIFLEIAAVAQSQTVNLYDKYFDSIVEIQYEEVIPNGFAQPYHASGFIVNESGFVITCAHVANHATGLVGRFAQRWPNPVMMRVVSIDAAADLALLEFVFGAPEEKAHLAGRPALRLGNSDGYPTTTRLQAIPFNEDIRIVDGILSGLTAGKRWITSLYVRPGDSGAPVFDSNGSVVGIVSSGYLDQPHFNTVIPTNLAKQICLKTTCNTEPAFPGHRSTTPASAAEAPSAPKDRASTERDSPDLVPVRSNASGLFATAVEPGVYRVRFESPGYDDVVYENVRVRNSVGVNLRAEMSSGGSRRRGADITIFDGPGGLIIGQVRDSLGEPLPKVAITIQWVVER